MKSTKERAEVSWKAVVSVEVSSNWTWLCAYKQQPAHPKSNYKMLQDHSMKLVSLTLFHPFLPLFVAQAFKRFSFFNDGFSRFAQKNKSLHVSVFTQSCPPPHMRWEHFEGCSVFLSNWCFEMGGWAYRGEERGGGGGVGVSKKLCRIWRVHDSDAAIRLTFSCACAQPSSYVLNLKSWWDERE